MRGLHRRSEALRDGLRRNWAAVTHDLPAALPFLFAGSRVPVKIGNIPNAVAIDREAAAAQDAR
jgi:hypothetical protein